MKFKLQMILGMMLIPLLTQAMECPSDLVRALNIGTASATLGMGITIRESDLEKAKANWEARIAQRKADLIKQAVELRVQSYQTAFDERERVIEERTKDLQTVDSLLVMVDQLYDLANRHINFRRSGVYKALTYVGLVKSQAQINDELLGVFAVINDRVEESIENVGRQRSDGAQLLSAMNDILGRDVLAAIDQNLLQAELGVLEGTALSMARLKMSLLELKSSLTAEVADLKLRIVSLYMGLCALKPDHANCSDLDIQKGLGLITAQEREAQVAVRQAKAEADRAQAEAARQEAARQAAIARKRAQEERMRGYDHRR